MLTMPYPDNVLAAEEQVVLHRHPHWKRLVGPILILIVATTLAAFGAGYVNQTDWDRTARNIVLIVIGVIWLVIVGWLTLWPFLTWLTTHFVITDRRVMFRHGLLTRSGIIKARVAALAPSISSSRLTLCSGVIVGSLFSASTRKYG